MNKTLFKYFSLCCASGLLLFVITILAYYIIDGANWTLNDARPLFQNTAIGKFFWESAAISMGRFTPLSFMDCNILLLFFPNGASATAHYTLSAIEFTVFVFGLVICLYVSNKDNFNTFKIWILLLYVLYIIQRIVCPVYVDLMYHERCICMLLPLIMLCLIQFHKTDKLSYAVVSLILSTYTIYCKEPMFGVYAIISGTQLLFNNNTLTKKQKFFYWTLLLDAIIYIVIYIVFVYENVTSVYKVADAFTLIVALKLLYRNKIFIFAILLAIYRFYCFCRHKDKLNIFDSLLLGGIAYMCALFILKMPYDYYYSIPTVLVCVPILHYCFEYISDWLTFVIMLVFTCLYTYKLRDLVENKNLFERQSLYGHIELIAGKYKAGYNLYYYMIDDNDMPFEPSAGIKYYVEYINRSQCDIKMVCDLNDCLKPYALIIPNESDAQYECEECFVDEFGKYKVYYNN